MFQVEPNVPGGQAARLSVTIQGPMFFPSCCSAIPWVLSGGSRFPWVPAAGKERNTKGSPTRLSVGGRDW